MDGLILVDKPQDITSHDVVARLRKILSLPKIGHFGTLDPLATGLLIAAVGKATKFFRFFSKLDKVYQGRIRLGFSTDSYDRSGVPLTEESLTYPHDEDVRRAMRTFEGEIDQTAPPFSAKKYRGKPLYTFARRKNIVKLPAFRVQVHSFLLQNYLPPYLDFEVKCSSGTYIRTLAHDLGRQLGCGAHLAELVRTEIGEFQVKDSFALEEIKDLAERGRVREFLRPLETLLLAFPKIELTQDGLMLVQNGRPVFPEHMVQPDSQDVFFSPPSGQKEAVFRLFSPEGQLVGLAKRRDTPLSFSPFLVLV
jgi:tRNA pseudouridine55 synthase